MSVRYDILRWSTCQITKHVSVFSTILTMMLACKIIVIKIWFYAETFYNNVKRLLFDVFGNLMIVRLLTKLLFYFFLSQLNEKQYRSIFTTIFSDSSLMNFKRHSHRIIMCISYTAIWSHYHYLSCREKVR